MPFPGNHRRDEVPPASDPPLSVVPRISRICALGLAFDELLGEVCREIRALSGADECLLFLRADDGDDYRRAASSGGISGDADPYLPGLRMERLLDRLRGEGVLRADDVALLPSSDPLREILESRPVRSALLVPLRFGTGLPGFLALHAAPPPRPWSDDALRALDFVAEILASALERRRAEERLHASEARYRFIAENSPDLISLHDASGRILYANPASSVLLGIPPGSMAGAPMEAFLHPEDAEKVAEDTRRVAEGGRGIVLLFRMRRSDGAFVEVESSATPVPGEAGEGHRVLRMTRDVSERIRMEGILRETHGRSTVGMLAGGVAHEFNNLLAGIQGAVEMLSMVVVENPKAKVYLDVILRMGNRAVELTHQLLAYARQGKYAPAVIPVKEIVGDAVSAVRSSLPEDIELSVEVGEGIPHVFVDGQQMRQVLLGLLLNAAEAMPGGGRISVRARREGGGGRVVVEVSDNGPGSDAATLPRIFEPFFSTKSAGRGMGLAAIRGIVENHDGEIRVASRPGEGSTFTVLLPVSVERRKSVRQLPAGVRPDTGTILLAEDEQDVRSVMRAMLESLGYSVVEAGDGWEAVEQFRKRRAEIDLVMMDLVMPRLSGEGALAEIRRIAPEARAILISGYDQSGRIGEILGEGFSGFLRKPFRRQDLESKIGEVLGAGGGFRRERP
jgi:PAS domain S-box-containing protein